MRRVIEILSAATQQCKNYLYDKTWTNQSHEVGGLRKMNTTSYSTLIETMRLSCTVIKIQPVICRKSPILTHPTYIWCPHREWPRSNFAETFGFRKLVPGLSCGVVCVILRLTVLVEHRTPTCDGQTDGRTQGHGQYGGCLASCGKN